MPPDELPSPVPTLAERRKRGFGSADAARLGGIAKAAKAELRRAMAMLLPGETVPEGSPMAAALGYAEDFRDSHLAALAASAGGHVGSGPASMVATAALQLAASRYLFAEGAKSGDAMTLKAASTIGNDSRQNLLAAYELAVREAKVRELTKGPRDPLAGFLPPARGK